MKWILIFLTKWIIKKVIIKAIRTCYTLLRRKLWCIIFFCQMYLRIIIWDVEKKILKIKLYNKAFQEYEKVLLVAPLFFFYIYTKKKVLEEPKT